MAHPDDRDLCIQTYIKSFTSATDPPQYRLQRGAIHVVEDTHPPAGKRSFAGYWDVVDIADRKRGVFAPDEESCAWFALTERERQVCTDRRRKIDVKEAPPD